MCRDVSHKRRIRSKGRLFSLRVQRCFLACLWGFDASWVFSACAEMFPRRRARPQGRSCFLCVCRDVSKWRSADAVRYRFSLRVQRCFWLDVQRGPLGQVFSACAEMFLSMLTALDSKQCFLCVCRDVPIYTDQKIAAA